MKLEYEATLEDITEPQLRYYFRSKSFSRQQYREPLWSGIGGSVALYLISSFREGLPLPWWAYVIAFVFGYLVIYSTFRDLVSKRIRKYMKREYGYKVPCRTIYVISDSQLRCSCLGPEIVFDLDSLSSVQEDAGRLELVFGDAGLCTIPLRVFRDSGHKAAFLQAVRRERDGGVSPAVPATS